MKRLIPLFVTSALAFAACSQAGGEGDGRAGNDVDLAVVDGANHGFDIKDGQLTPEGELAGVRVLEWLARHFS